MLALNNHTSLKEDLALLLSFSQLGVIRKTEVRLVHPSPGTEWSQPKTWNSINLWTSFSTPRWKSLKCRSRSLNTFSSWRPTTIRPFVISRTPLREKKPRLRSHPTRRSRKSHPRATWRTFLSSASRRPGSPSWKEDSRMRFSTVRNLRRSTTTHKRPRNLNRVSWN